MWGWAVNDVIQDWINDSAGKVGAFDALMKLSANDLVYAVPVLLLMLWFIPATNRALNQRLAFAIFAAVLFSLGLASGLGHLYHEARPFVSDSSTKLLVSHSSDNSFPSEHAVFIFSVAGVVVWWHRKLGLALLWAALLVGVARIYVGVHWPLDIVTSALVGLVVGALCARLVPLLSAPQQRLARHFPRLLLEKP
jgi:undecaprenyl-diphosphatase